MDYHRSRRRFCHWRGDGDLHANDCHAPANRAFACIWSAGCGTGWRKRIHRKERPGRTLQWINGRPGIRSIVRRINRDGQLDGLW